MAKPRTRTQRNAVERDDSHWLPQRSTSLTRIAKECPPVVYAFRTRDGLIKIGHTKDIAQRAGSLGGGLRSLLALKPGTYADEQEIHRSLKGRAARGREYYPADDPAVLAVVNEMRAAMGFEPI